MGLAGQQADVQRYPQLLELMPIQHAYYMELKACVKATAVI
jgi:hypothetical protein